MSVACFTVWVVVWCTVVANLFQQHPHFSSGQWAPLMGAFPIIEWLFGRPLDGNTVSELVIPFFVFWIAAIGIVAISGCIAIGSGAEEKQEEDDGRTTHASCL